MATTTTNLSLKKPALDDDALIADINNNMDTLDSTIGAPSSASAVDGANAFAKINSLNGKIAVQGYAGNLDSLTHGTFYCRTSECSNLPNTTNTAWVVKADAETMTDGNTFGLQIAIGYNTPTEVYIRRACGGWGSWTKLALNSSVTPETFTPTANTSCINANYQGTKSCYRIGKLCIVSIVNFRFGNIPAAGTTIFSNMPSAAQYVRTRAYTTEGKEFLVTTNGTNLIASTAPLTTGEDYTLEFSYACA